jgi:two-component system, NarL family, nitrate/nitrite response regulator NarL
MSDVPTRLGLVEDNGLLRHALAQALGNDGFDVVFAASTAHAALEHLDSDAIDVLVVDLHLGEGLNGLDVSLVWQKSHPDLGVVYLTSYEDPRIVVGSAWPKVARNSIYLVKAALTEGTELADAIRRVAAHDGNDTVERVGPLAKLTEKQMETLALLAAGHSNLEIAKHRGISEQSVAISINRLSKALGIPSHLTRNQRVHLARVYLDRAGEKYA